MMGWAQEVMNHPNWHDHAAFNQACDAAFAQLTRVTELQPFTADVPSVVCVARNEEIRLPHFIEHYKGMGVKSLHIVDNDSTDDTADICASDPCVTLWQTRSSYAEAAIGQLWVGAIVRKYGIGKWLFNVDADEFFAYADMDRHGVGDLQAWLDMHGRNRVFAPMIDMYGSRLYGDGAAKDPRPPLGQTPFFDGGADGKSRSYRFDETPRGPLLTGGPRGRMMAMIDDPTQWCLSKFPLSRWTDDTAYANVHWPYPFTDNRGPAFGALLHFKFLADFVARVDAAVSDGEHWANVAKFPDYHLYQRWVDGDGRKATLFSKRHSRMYRGPQSLVAAGLLEQIPWVLRPTLR